MKDVPFIVGHFYFIPVSRQAHWNEPYCPYYMVNQLRIELTPF